CWTTRMSPPMQIP
nr:Chain C, RON2 peptide [Plasmodium falciparum]6N87_C Chain C, backbone-cyclised peptide bcRON2hp [Plasmodium falciparum]